MTPFLPDANLLIAVFETASNCHETARSWLRGEMERRSPVFLTEICELAFLRIRTDHRVYGAAGGLVLQQMFDELHQYGGVRRIHPGPRHTTIFRDFVQDLGMSGNDLNDAWLAALAIEHRATLVSFDQGFARFPGLDWLDPSAS